MITRLCKVAVSLLLLTGMQVWSVLAQGTGVNVSGRDSQVLNQAQTQQAVEPSVPKDLRPLLLPRQSEMRLITQWYNADRATLNSNYDGSGRGGGRGVPSTRDANVSLSVDRIARLKRYDIDWMDALDRLDANKLSPMARTDLGNLKTAIELNLKQLDADASTIARLIPLLPFAPAIIQLNEARIRMEDVDAKKAAGIVTEITKQIGQIRAQLEDGLSATPTSVPVIRINKDLSASVADAAERLRNSVRSWFNFSNGYVPIFTWWMEMPYKQVDTALQEYVTFLREKVAAADLQTSEAVLPKPLIIAPSPAPALNEVPDLQELLNSPQDEMTNIVQQYLEGSSGSRGGRGATGATSRNIQYYKDWSTALKTLNFDKLSRNAQVDYLYIKKMCEIQIAHSSVQPQTNIPRKNDDSGITGAARGRVGLIIDLENELIPYTPEELIALANKEFAWCEEEMRKASRAMGLGDDWKMALEKVKDMHVPPGQQPGVIRDLLFEAVDYLRARDLLTIPQVASESLHMGMMSPQRQLVNPFFTGGSQITVSYPTNTMEYSARIQSMRGNSPPLSHATAFHEMIPGHNFVGYMSARYAGYRANLSNTSFYGEGWPLYWEIMMYEMGFHDTPEKKVGALFWRMHRCARIIFSLNFHMGEWSPQECVDFLVDRVGFERNNAIGEVRRSFQGGYGPLYQAAYLLGGLQLRALRRELVDSRQMTAKHFHNEIMRQGSMPITVLRLTLNNQKLTRDIAIDWKFYGDNPGK